MQSDQTYLVLVGLSSAIVNALPEKNADGTFNTAARDAAVVQIGRPSCSGRPAKQPEPSLFQVSQRSRDTRGHLAIVKLRRVVSTHRALSALGIRTSEIKIEMFIRTRAHYCSTEHSRSSSAHAWSIEGFHRRLSGYSK